MPTPIPIADQVKQVFLVAKLDSYEQAATLINLLQDSVWLEVVECLDRFELVRNNFTEIKNGLLGANISPSAQRLAIRNDIRRLLGLPELESESVRNSGNRSSSVPITVLW